MIKNKKEIVAKFQVGPKDAGSSPVQVALLTERIRYLSEHLKTHPKDHHSQLGLLKMVGQRKRHLTYVKRRQPDQYQKLVRGEAGGNVLYKHKVWLISSVAAAWVKVVFAITERMVCQQAAEEETQTIPGELSALQQFVTCCLTDAFAFDAIPPMRQELFTLDVLTWMDERCRKPLATYRCDPAVPIAFQFTEDQLAIKQDARVRYGDTLSGKVKLVQRLGSIQRCFRKATRAAMIEAGT